MVELDGGCCVTSMFEGPGVTNGTLTSGSQVDRCMGAKEISLRVLRFAPGLSPGLRNSVADEVLYFIENLDQVSTTGEVTVYLDGEAFRVRPQTGIYLQPNKTLKVDNAGPDDIVFVSSRCPEPTGDTESEVKPLTAQTSERVVAKPIVNLHDRRAMPTADRWYRVLIDDEVGSKQVTQFVGSIPPGRAPDHFHTYEEVLFILRGTGRMWAGDRNTEIGPGSCVYLPPRQVHCVENTGDSELRLLGVFYPAGSPAVRYES